MLSAASPDLPPPLHWMFAGPCEEAGLLQRGILRHLSVRLRSFELLSSHGLVALEMCGSLQTRCSSPEFNSQVVFKRKYACDTGIIRPKSIW